jgi:glycosyltransferase involved in cell wall biosynthesis
MLATLISQTWVILRCEKYEGLYLARLAINKGILRLVDIWRFGVANFPSATLGIIGTGNPHTVRMLEHKIQRAHLWHSIKILGFLNDSRKCSVLESGKVFVYPSYEESFGIVIIEAMTCGLPVVTNKAWRTL